MIFLFLRMHNDYVILKKKKRKIKKRKKRNVLYRYVSSIAFYVTFFYKYIYVLIYIHIYIYIYIYTYTYIYIRNILQKRYTVRSISNPMSEQRPLSVKATKNVACSQIYLVVVFVSTPFSPFLYPVSICFSGFNCTLF